MKKILVVALAGIAFSTVAICTFHALLRKRAILLLLLQDLDRLPLRRRKLLRKLKTPVAADAAGAQCKYPMRTPGW